MAQPWCPLRGGYVGEQETGALAPQLHPPSLPPAPAELGQREPVTRGVPQGAWVRKAGSGFLCGPFFHFSVGYRLSQDPRFSILQGFYLRGWGGAGWGGRDRRGPERLCPPQGSGLAGPPRQIKRGE